MWRGTNGCDIWNWELGRTISKGCWRNEGTYLHIKKLGRQKGRKYFFLFGGLGVLLLSRSVLRHINASRRFVCCWKRCQVRFPGFQTSFLGRNFSVPHFFLNSNYANREREEWEKSRTFLHTSFRSFFNLIPDQFETPCLFAISQSIIADLCHSHLGS